MKEQIKSIIKDLEDICVSDCIKSFYIGKTANVNDRECEQMNRGYSNFSELAKGKSEDINEAEKELISYFSKSVFASKFNNKNQGGGGNPSADTLYAVFITQNIQDISELNGSLFSNRYPITLK